jgi:thiamine-phosphate pyrophosphorylase
MQVGWGRYDEEEMSPIARIIDANANRAREAMRVMEDAARFALNDAKLTEQIKSLRHDLRAALGLLAPGILEANRDTPADVGTTVTTAAEMNRRSLLDIVIAAAKRLSESLRSIEECSKTLNTELARQIESLRYRAYAIEMELQLRFGTGRASQWTLCVLLTESLCKRPWKEVLRAAIDGGADCIQIREKEFDGGDLAERVREVISIARPAGVAVIVNDRVDVALAVGADGAHLGQHDLAIRDARRLAGRSLIIGSSTRNLDEARRAVEAGADYCGVGMIFPTPLKPGQEASGLRYLREFLEAHPDVPHLAIGGITPANVREVIDAGAKGIAVSTAVCAAENPRAVVEALIQAHSTLSTQHSAL